MTATLIQALTLPPLSLYIHIPWCIKKCPYCDFNSHAVTDSLPEQDYINALLDDLQQDLQYVQDRKLQSIFIGGGTPSLFSTASFAELLSAIKSSIAFEDDIEITLEANPGTFEQEKFSGYRESGINRLSIGVQSFQDNFLQPLGRIHSGNEAMKATDIARQAGFTNVNLDLMFGLPGQNTETALNDLQQAISCNPAHISWYQLTIEPNTVFYNQPPKLPSTLLIENIQNQGVSLLKQANFSRYEISAYGQAEKFSRHNLNYWQFGDYLGIGAGAHGKITLPLQQQIIRTQKNRQPKTYLDPDVNYLATTNPIAAQDLVLEFMMNALRLKGGVTESLLELRTGISAASISSILDDLRDKKLLHPTALATTARGYNLLNNVLQAFMT